MTFGNPISEYSVLSHITKSVVRYGILDFCVCFVGNSGH
jgi:hypothetical protein